MIVPRGVKLEMKKEPSLQLPIRLLPAPKELPAPKMFAPLRRKAAASKIIFTAKTAGILDESDSTELNKKLSRLAASKIHTLVARCFDEDPFTSCSEAVLRENADQVVAGLKLAARACGAEKIVIAAASRAEASRAAISCKGIRVESIGNRYPAGVFLLRRLHRKGEKAAYIGAQACVALAAAARQGRAQSETVVTVAGDGADRWLNCRVRIGTPIRTVLEAGLPDDKTSAVIIGSGVTGTAVEDLSVPIKADTHCVIAMKKIPKQRPFPCIRCDRCARACPVGIIPWMALHENQSETPNPFRLINVQYCIRCAACSMVCPSGIDLVAEVRRAAEIKEGRNSHEIV